MGTLTVPAIRAAKHPGGTKRPVRIGDGDGLYVQITPGGSKSWLFRFTLAGKAREMGLGSVATTAKEEEAGGVPLARARDLARDASAKLRAGVDPIEDKRQAEAAREAAAKAAAARAVTFADAAERFRAAHAAGWRNAKHRAQWEMTLRDYAGPHLGALPVAEVETRHVEAALRPLWHEKPETATRLRGRIEAVLDCAAVQGWRDGANPARWRGHLDKLFPRRAKVRPVEHHAALPWQDIGAFMVTLRQREATAARALELAILTAARSGEVLGMRWSEVDLTGAVWTVPKERMKAGREHRVPLSPAAVAVLRGMLTLSEAAEESDPLVFPGQRERRPLSVMAMTMALRRMERGDITPHGFRSTFRDWAGETTAHAREVVEQALAHRLGDKVEQAYARGDLFQKRRKLMEDWADFCAKAPAGVADLTAERAKRELQAGP